MTKKEEALIRAEVEWALRNRFPLKHLELITKTKPRRRFDLMKKFDRILDEIALEKL